MRQVLPLFRGEELEDGQILGVAGLVLFGMRIGELAEGFQGGDGGHKEGLVARPFHAADSRFGRFVVGSFLLSGCGFRHLRSLPAVHRLAEDGGALGLAERRALPGGGARPAFFDLAEISGDDERLGGQLLGDFGVRMTQEVQTLDFGKERVFVHRRWIFFFNFFIHVLLVFPR
jgi:hypothetical protein